MEYGQRMLRENTECRTLYAEEDKKLKSICMELTEPEHESKFNWLHMLSLANTPRYLKIDFILSITADDGNVAHLYCS